MKTTTTAALHGAAIRPWDSPELKAIYWAGANYARKVGLLK